MTLTNPGAISNSGGKRFTNQFGTIAKLNYNKQYLLMNIKLIKIILGMLFMQVRNTNLTV